MNERKRYDLVSELMSTLYGKYFRDILVKYHHHYHQPSFDTTELVQKLEGIIIEK